MSEKSNKTRFDNQLTISGKITKKDDMINYIPTPLFGFELENSNNCSNEELNSFRVIIFNDEEFYLNYEIGDRVLIKGEIQSRNFYQKHIMTEDEVENAVDLYQELFDELPTEKKPTQFFREPICWKKLFEYNLLDRVPSDSVYNEDQKYELTEQTPYEYKVDWNGEVSKETKETIYEVLAHSYERIDEEFEDVNEYFFKGRISTEPLFDVEGTLPESTFTAQSYLNYFKNDTKRYAFLPFRSEGGLAENILSEYQKNNFVIIKGVFVSRMGTKILRLKKTTPSGKTKRKKVELEDLKRFIIIQSIEKQEDQTLNK